MNLSRKLLITLTILFAHSAWSIDLNQGDVYINGHHTSQLQAEPSVSLSNSSSNFTVLDPILYQQVINDSFAQVQQLLNLLQSKDHLNANSKVELISQQLMNIPFITSGAEGEGDWQPSSFSYKPNAAHVKQDPVYRLDGFNCLTFVQVAMALLYSYDLNSFDKNILKISYGAAGNSTREIVHYYNRNHFIDGDWNPINRRNGWLSDVTSQGDLSSYNATTSVNLTRQNWFLLQLNDLSSTVRVLNSADGPAMLKRYQTVYTALNYQHFDNENVTMSFIPKETIAIAQPMGTYIPNKRLLDKIPTPAVMEIIRDARKWTVDGKNIKDAIGSELSVSHMGLLYRKTLHQGELIYNRVTCYYNNRDEKTCSVRPIICQKKLCNELMFVNVSSALPNGYYWYKKPDGRYTCSSKLPTTTVPYTRCNRVREVPLFDYLTDYQYGSYWYMNNSSILGIHIEKLSDPS